MEDFQFRSYSNRHLKILMLCCFLFVFPLYMTYILCYIFDLNFWTLVVISTCVMTSVQVPTC